MRRRLFCSQPLQSLPHSHPYFSLTTCLALRQEPRRHHTPPSPTHSLEGTNQPWKIQLNLAARSLHILRIIQLTNNPDKKSSQTPNLLPSWPKPRPTRSLLNYPAPSQPLSQKLTRMLPLSPRSHPSILSPSSVDPSYRWSLSRWSASAVQVHYSLLFIKTHLGIN